MNPAYSTTVWSVSSLLAGSTLAVGSLAVGWKHSEDTPHTLVEYAGLAIRDRRPLYTPLQGLPRPYAVEYRGCAG